MAQLMNPMGEPLKNNNISHVNDVKVDEVLKHVETLDVKSIIPLENQLIIKVASDVSLKSSGGIWLPATEVEMSMMNKCSGEFIKCGEEAFLNSHGDYINNKPEIGDIIIFAKHAGAVFKDENNSIYRFCEDRDVKAIIKKGS